MTQDKPTTVLQLKTFIDAVEFAADSEAEWIPSERQWKRIRSMIQHLEEVAPLPPPPPPRELRYAAGQTFPHNSVPDTLTSSPPQLPQFAAPQHSINHSGLGGNVPMDSGTYKTPFA